MKYFDTLFMIMFSLVLSLISILMGKLQFTTMVTAYYYDFFDQTQNVSLLLFLVQIQLNSQYLITFDN